MSVTAIRAAAFASREIRAGRQAGLSVHIAAREFGVSRHAVAAAMARRRPRRRVAQRREESVPPVGAWWL